MYIFNLKGHSHNFEKNLLRVAWSPDGQLVSAGSADKMLYIWEVEYFLMKHLKIFKH